MAKNSDAQNNWDTMASREIVSKTGNTHYTPSAYECLIYNDKINAYLAGKDIETPEMLVCGSTPNLVKLGLDKKFAVTCVDLFPAMVKKNKEQIEKFQGSKTVNYICENWLQMGNSKELKARRFDVVIGDAILNNLAYGKWSDFLGVVKKLLKHDGLLLIKEIVVTFNEKDNDEERLKSILNVYENKKTPWTDVYAALRFGCFSSCYDSETKQYPAAAVFGKIKKVKTELVAKLGEDGYRYMVAFENDIIHTMVSADDLHKKINKVFLKVKLTEVPGKDNFKILTAHNGCNSTHSVFDLNEKDEEYHAKKDKNFLKSVAENFFYGKFVHLAWVDWAVGSMEEEGHAGKWVGSVVLLHNLQSWVVGYMQSLYSYNFISTAAHMTEYVYQGTEDTKNELSKKRTIFKVHIAQKCVDEVKVFREREFQDGTERIVALHIYFPDKFFEEPAGKFRPFIENLKQFFLKNSDPKLEHYKSDPQPVFDFDEITRVYADRWFNGLSGESQAEFLALIKAYQNAIDMEMRSVISPNDEPYNKFLSGIAKTLLFGLGTNCGITNVDYIAVPSFGMRGIEKSLGGLMVLYRDTNRDQEQLTEDLRGQPRFTGSAYYDISRLTSEAAEYGHKSAIWKIYNTTVADYKNQSRKSARAAIMARNMSHNIGSHVLSKASGDVSSQGSADRTLFNYIQQRMDFIALITTKIPAWTYSAWFLRNVIKYFYSQKHLLSYIAESDGLKAFDWNDASSLGKLIVKVRRKVGGGYEVNSPENLDNDVLLRIPGGTVGLHAFYVILENIIRNSAKHNFATAVDKAKPFIINIGYEDNPDNDDVRFQIWDSYSEVASGELLPKGWEEWKQDAPDWERLPLHQKINYKLAQSFIDDRGRLKKENWGLAEIKISAGYLQKEKVSRVDAAGEKVLEIVRAVPVQDNAEMHLGYEFDVPRPQEVVVAGLLWNEFTVKKFKQESVHVFDAMPEEVDSDFCVMFWEEESGVNRFLKSICDCTGDRDSIAIVHELERLPYRLFVSTKSNRLKNKISECKLLRERIAVLDVEEILKNIGSAAELKKHLYREWLKFLLRRRGGCRLSLEVQIAPSEDGGRAETSQDEKVVTANFEEFKTLIHSFFFDKGQPLLLSLIENVVLDLKSCGTLVNIAQSLEGEREKLYPKMISIVDELQAKINAFYEKYLPSRIDSVPAYLVNEDTTGTSIADRQTALEAALVRHVQEFNGLAPVGDEWKISYLRHTRVAVRPAGYEEDLSGASTHFSLLQHGAIDDELFFHLAENGILGILIIDERLAEYAAQNTTVNNRLAAANIFVVSRLVKTPSEAEEEKKEEGVLPLVAERGSGLDFVIQPDGERRSLQNVGLEEKIDVAIVHQGVLDKIAEKWKKTPNEFVGLLKQKFPFVVVTTGRGEPDHLPKNAKLLPFSSLESFLFSSSHEKFLLVQTLMNLRNRLAHKENYV